MKMIPGFGLQIPHDPEQCATSCSSSEEVGSSRIKSWP